MSNPTGAALASGATPPNSPAGTRSSDGSAPIQLEARECPYDHVLFVPKRQRQDFCNDKCRLGYHKDVGTEGAVAGVTRIKRGVSVVLHFATGPAAERAIRLLKGERKRIV